MRCLRYIPFVAPLTSFGFDTIKRALRETFILWLISTFPILLTALRDLQGDHFSWEAWMVAQLDLKVIFVYATSFLAPVLLLFLDRGVSPKKLRDNIFRGATLVFIFSVGILLTSAWFYGNRDLKSSSLTIWLCYAMYILSVYFWFLTIADEENDGRDYGVNVARAEDDFAKLAAQKKTREENS